MRDPAGINKSLMREIVNVLIEGGFYFRLSLRERYSLVMYLADKMTKGNT